MLLLDRFFQVSLSIAISRSLVCPDRQNDHIADIVLVLASTSVGACWWPLFLSHGYESKPWYHLVPWNRQVMDVSSPKIPQIWCIFPCISWVLTEVLTQIQDSKPRSGSPGSPTSLSHSRSNENAKMGCMMVCGWSKRTSMSAGVGLALRIPAKKLVSAPKKHQLGSSYHANPIKPYQTLRCLDFGYLSTAHCS